MKEEYLHFFEELVDAKTIDNYHKLKNIENKNVLQLEMKSIQKMLKKAINIEKIDSFFEKISILIQNFIYSLNSRGVEKDLQREEDVSLGMKFLRVEKECLQFLKHALNGTILEEDILIQQETIPEIYLCFMAITTLSKNRKDYFDRQYTKIECGNKNISVIFPESGKNQDLSSGLKSISKVKKYSYGLVKQED